MPTNGVKTFYDILGVTKDASKDDLRKAWLTLARKHHPDKTGGHKGSEEKLKIINEAYDTLKRPEKRRQYDETLSGAFRGDSPFNAGTAHEESPYNTPGKAGNFAYDVDYADFFGDLFGQKTRERQRGPRPGRDLEIEVSVSLKESAMGTRKSFRLASTAVCHACSGSGAAPGTRPQPCPQCKGAGHISSGGGSLFVMSQPCPLCRGRGTVIVTPCPQCKGTGSRAEVRTFSITIPPGVRPGARLRLAGQGEPGEPDAPAGDLFVVVNVEESKLFQRKRNDLLCEVPITFTQAVLGDTVEVPTLHGKARLKIPAGTQPGAILRMRGQGFPAINGGQIGDQLVKVVVEIPQKITQDQVEAIRKFHETNRLESYPKRANYADNLKRWCES